MDENYGYFIFALNYTLKLDLKYVFDEFIDYQQIMILRLLLYEWEKVSVLLQRESLPRKFN